LCIQKAHKDFLCLIGTWHHTINCIESHGPPHFELKIPHIAKPLDVDANVTSQNSGQHLAFSDDFPKLDFIACE
jgi:hypothetical protein